MRTIVDLPEEQLAALARFCGAQNISRAEAVRRAVDKLIQDVEVPVSEIGFGAWSHKRGNAHEHLAVVRKEWD